MFEPHAESLVKMDNVKVSVLCPFCEIPARHWDLQNTSGLYGFDCPTCKQYFISYPVFEFLKNKPLDSKKLNCISENIKSNSKDGEVITSWHLEKEVTLPALAKNVTVKRFEAIADLQIIHAAKTDDLLVLFAEKAAKLSPFAEVGLELSDIYSLKIATFEECFVWLSQLQDWGHIESIFLKSKRTTIGNKPSNKDIQNFKVSITPAGWASVYERQKTLNSKKVFIAMQFKWGDELMEVKSKFLEAIIEGCRDCGYEADIVSQVHADQITDRIISEIKSAKFVIADFTYNNQGAYYEAGFARGLGKKVIHTVRIGHVDRIDDPQRRLHFDIKQINYLEWSDPLQVRAAIRDRIRAVIEN